MSIQRQIASVFASVILAASACAGAAPLNQYASTVQGFSSEYQTAGQGWRAVQVLGAPDTNVYGDIGTAWAPVNRNGTQEWISVGFGQAVYATGAVIRENYNNGFVYQVDAIDTFGNLHPLWNGMDTSAPNVLFDFTVSWATTSYLVNGLKVYIDTDHTKGWEEIDAIRLLGDTQAPPAARVPEPGSLALMGLGLLAIARLRRRTR